MIDYSVMTEKLTGDYKEALKTVELYGIVKNIDTDVQDEMMMNLFAFKIQVTAFYRRKQIFYLTCLV